VLRRAWEEKQPWLFVAIGVVIAVIVLGYTGHLASITPVDRVFNPDARN
jgi:hypothetical protein